MTREKFEAIVKRLERMVEERPSLYKFKVTMVMLLGYLYIFLVLAILIGGVGGLGYAAFKVRGTAGIVKIRKVAIPLLVLAYAIFKSLRIKIEEPQGIKVSKEDGKKLYDMVEEIRKELKTPKVHEIILTDEQNAAICQHPRLGMLGFYKNYLIVGMPLMMSLSTEEFKGVIAHELGHLSGKHGKLGSWIYRIQSTWEKLMDNLEENHEKSTWIFKKFVNWYVPFLNAYTFVLRRENEYVADRLAAEIVHKDVMANALMKLHVTSQYVDYEFWKNVFEKAKTHANPMDNVYNEMLNSLKKGIEYSKASKWLNDALSMETEAFSTHPCLSDRIKALKANRNISLMASDDALTTLFNNNLNEYMDQINKQWQEDVYSYWYGIYIDFKAAKKELLELQNKEELSIEESFNKATLVEKIHGEEAALEEYKEILRRDEAYAPAVYSVGRILIEQGNGEGREFLEKAMKIEVRFTVEACRLIHNYLVGLNRIEEAKEYYERACETKKILELAEEERESVRFSDSYCDHNIESEKVEYLRNLLPEFDQVKEAYLVRKDVKYLKESPLYVLGVKINENYKGELQEYCQNIAEEIELLDECFVVPLHKANEKLEGIMKGIEGSKIYG